MSHHTSNAVRADAIQAKYEAALLETSSALRTAYDAGIAFRKDVQEAHGAALEAAVDISRLGQHVEHTAWVEDGDVLLAAASVLQRVSSRHAGRLLGIVEAYVDQAIENHGLAR